MELASKQDLPSHEIPSLCGTKAQDLNDAAVKNLEPKSLEV